MKEQNFTCSTTTKTTHIDTCLFTVSAMIFSKWFGVSMHDFISGMSSILPGACVTKIFQVKSHISQQKFSSLESDWLAAQPCGMYTHERKVGKVQLAYLQEYSFIFYHMATLIFPRCPKFFLKTTRAVLHTCGGIPYVWNMNLSQYVIRY